MAERFVELCHISDFDLDVELPELSGTQTELPSGQPKRGDPIIVLKRTEIAFDVC